MLKDGIFGTKISPPHAFSSAKSTMFTPSSKVILNLVISGSVIVIWLSLLIFGFVIIRDLLFEPITPLTALSLQRKVEEVLTNYEPRINLVQILARPDIDRNDYHLTVSFYVIGVSDPVTIETILERLR